MTTVSNLLYNFHQFVSGIICLAILATFFGFASGSPLKPDDKVNSVLLFAFFGGTTLLAWYLRQRGFHTITVAVLGIIWIVILLGILYTISKARWN